MRLLKGKKVLVPQELQHFHHHCQSRKREPHPENCSLLSTHIIVHSHAIYTEIIFHKSIIILRIKGVVL